MINDIVIVGGGSAGWMTAAALIKSFPEKNIRVIESPKVPTVGVGESTYDGISYFMEYLEIDRKDFFEHTNASIKLGIEFKNFYQNDGSAFLYPFGGGFVHDTAHGMKDWMIRKYKNPDLPVTDFAESYFPVSFLIKHNTILENKNNEYPSYHPILTTSLHFDAFRFALWLRDRYCLPRGVKHTLANVDDIIVTNSSITKLILDSGEEVVADLFVDCTGFKSMLLSGALKEPFIEYYDKLPNTSAWATQMPYDDRDVELTTITRCTALKNGWVWNIPLYSRLGAGYVYSNKFTSKEDALEEFKQHLMSDDMDHPKSKEVVDSLQFNHIDMRVGIHERIWVGNVVAIGLSAGFIEPLESNGLFTVHEFLFHLIRALKRGNATAWDKKVFNQSSRNLYQSFAEFIRLHYALSIRDDSEYWRYVTSMNYDFDEFNLAEIYSAITLKLFNMQNKTHELIPTGGFLTGVACVATGMNFMVWDDVTLKNEEMRLGSHFFPDMQKWFDKLDAKKVYWDSIARNCEKLPQYLDRYHS